MVWNNKNGLDEMQRARRNSAGNQMFMLMFYALLLNTGLYGAGIRWLNYPADVTVITTICMGIYLVRLISMNAYLPAKAQNRKTVVILVMAIAFSVALTISAIRLFGAPAEGAGASGVNPALIGMVISAVGLLGTMVVAVTKWRSNKDDDNKD